jgi:hypothetical protein
VGAWIVEHNNDMEKRAAVRALLEKHGVSHIFEDIIWPFSQFNKRRVVERLLLFAQYKAYDVENPGVDDYFMEPKVRATYLHA